ncbi:MAG: four helix bundle protein [Candidatus Paceibacterota bacterium]
MNDFKKRFEERIYKYAVDIVKFVKLLPNDLSSRELAKQLVRSGTSITANIIEGKSARTKKDYINFYTIALKSANETILWIKLITETSRTDIELGDKLLKETEEIAKILGASIITMKNKK